MSDERLEKPKTDKRVKSHGKAVAFSYIDEASAMLQKARCGGVWGRTRVRYRVERNRLSVVVRQIYVLQL